MILSGFRDLENDKAVDAVLHSKGKQQQELISNLIDDEKYQREAFTALFMKQDGRHKEITNQVEQIQNELAKLTVIEMTKKDLKVETEFTYWNIFIWYLIVFQVLWYPCQFEVQNITKLEFYLKFQIESKMF